MKAPDKAWIPFAKIVFGYLLLIALFALAVIETLRKVRSESSYGLDIILGGLLTLAGSFASWAFRNHDESGDDDERSSTKP
jgi:hypothetical protein